MAFLDPIDRNQRYKGLSGTLLRAGTTLLCDSSHQSQRQCSLMYCEPLTKVWAPKILGPCAAAQVALLLAWPCLEANLTFGLIDALTI
jgi:hypothetical protein